jgi:hypothetical protein
MSRSAWPLLLVLWLALALALTLPARAATDSPEPAQAADPGAERWRDPLGYTAGLLAAACSLEDTSAEALGRALGGATLVEQKLFQMGGQTAGARRRYRLGNGDEVVMQHASPGGLLRRFAVEFDQRQPNGSLRPLATTLAGSDCAVFHGRLIRYDAEGLATSLELFGADLSVPEAAEPLNPPVPEGRDPGGVAVALFDSGLNYALPPFAERLARDSEGKSLGYDFWDLDERPFDSHPTVSPFFPFRHGTAVASVLLNEAPATRLLPYRYPRPDLGRMANMVEAAAGAGAVIAAMPMASDNPADWRAFAAAAETRPDMLFVVSAGNNGRDIEETPLYPAAFGLENLLVVTSAETDGSLAAGANWGAESVDLMVPAENLPVIDFTGAPDRGSGSSYAVPRVAALAARLLAAHPDWRAPQLKAAILARAQPPQGDAAGRVRHGFIADPAAGL